MTRADREAYYVMLSESLTRKARTDLLSFTEATMPNFDPAEFHRRYYARLTDFARGEIDRLMVFVPPQHGKQIADDQPVYTPDGIKRHGDLRVGDRVFGRDGRPVRVEWVSPKTRSQYVVTFSDGASIACHGHHEWTVLDRETGREQTLETETIAARMMTGAREGRFQVDGNVCVQFDARPVIVDPYAIGAQLWGDSGAHLPDEYVFNSEAVRRELLAGVVDSAGEWDAAGERVALEFFSRQTTDRIALVIRSLGHSVKREGRTRISFAPTEKPSRRDIVRIERRGDLGWGRCIQVEGGVYLVGETFIPTHNSEGSTRRLPAFVLGQNPDTKIAIVSYSATKARKFNREIQRIIDTEEYRRIFPATSLNASNVATIAGAWLRNADECEIVGRAGSFKTVGVGGPLTGDPVDLLIMDDIYKDAKEAWSPRVRENISDWYDTVAETRLHNHSRQLIVFTRWHEDDLAGKLLREQGAYDPATNPRGWEVVVYPAIKIGAPTEADPRQEGEALWPERHSLEKLQTIRARNPHVFDSLYQQDPKPSEGLMYDRGFQEYEYRPAAERVTRKAYVDTADTGADFLCAIVYDETETGNYIVDVLYTQRPMEYTEPALAEMLSRHSVLECVVESNNGGRGYARAVEQQCRRMGNDRTHFKWFHQSQNKAVRIFTHSAAVQNLTYMPLGWQRRFPEFAVALTGYLKMGTNAHDDAPDALTGTVEFRRKASSASAVAGLFGY